MNAAIGIGNHFRAALRNHELRAELAKEDRDTLDERIEERASQIIDADLAQMTPRAMKALREVLDAHSLSDRVADVLHAMLWRPGALETLEAAADLRDHLRLMARADLEYSALAQAEREIDAPREIARNANDLEDAP